MNVDAMRERIKPRKRRFFLFLFFKKRNKEISSMNADATREWIKPWKRRFFFLPVFFFSLISATWEGLLRGEGFPCLFYL